MSAIGVVLKNNGNNQKQMIKWALGGWVFFIAENAILSENRTYIINQLSDDTYHLIYGTCSTIATASIFYSYRVIKQQQQQPKLPPASLSNVRIGAAGTLISIGLILASQAIPKLQIPVTLSKKQQQVEDQERSSNNTDSSTGNWNLQVRCPFDFTDKKNNNNDSNVDTITGLDRISRHSGLWSLGLVFAGNACLQPTLPLQLWMLGPSMVALLGGSHTDSRFRRGLGGTIHPEYDRQTSNIPFIAMILGKQGTNSFTTWITEEMKPLNATIATLIAWSWVLVNKGRGAGTTVNAATNAASRISSTTVANGVRK